MFSVLGVYSVIEVLGYMFSLLRNPLRGCTIFISTSNVEMWSQHPLLTFVISVCVLKLLSWEYEIVSCCGFDLYFPNY